MTAQHRIEPMILAILSGCVARENAIALPPGNLDRKTYEAVNKVLELMGGKWNRAKKVHIFPENPAELLDTVLLTGEITDKKKLFQQFFTPADIADRLVRRACISPDSRILEPSVGRGALLHAVHRLDRTCGGEADGEIVCVDTDPLCMNHIAGHFPHVQRITADFTELTPDSPVTPGGSRLIGTFDRIIMNPPFTRTQDVRHILHATKFIRQPEGGRIVAICANGPRQHASLEHLASFWEDLPRGTFAESGTDVSAALVVLDL